MKASKIQSLLCPNQTFVIQPSGRIKAINTLPNFGDPEVINQILPILEKSENYIFYEQIVEMVLALDAMPEYESELRAISFKAMKNEIELKK